MPRDLADVLDYFLPASERPAASRRSQTGRPRRRRRGAAAPPLERPAALPIVALPIGDRDVVRAAFAWNLAVEVARRGSSAVLVAPQASEPSTLWPEGDPGPVGAQLVLTPARSAADLVRAALDVAVALAADAREGGLVLVRVPPAWLREAAEAQALLRWVLLFTSTDRGDLRDAYALAERVLSPDPERRVGVTIHGVRRVAEAQRAFDQLALAASHRLSRSLVSYGLLVDDLHVYRAIVSRRPIGLEHPQSRAARALGDVARLLLEDAGFGALA